VVAGKVESVVYAPHLTPVVAATPTTAEFSAFDAELAARRGGVLLARVSSQAVADAVLAHATRRLLASEVRTIAIPSQQASSLWHEVGARLGLFDLEGDAHRAAERIEAASIGHPVAVVAPLPRAGTWDRLLATQLCNATGAPETSSRLRQPDLLLVFVTTDADLAEDLAATTFDVPATLDDDGKARFFNSLCEEATRRIDSDDVTVLERWWRAARNAPAEGATLPPLPLQAEALFTSLTLAMRGYPLRSDLASLGGDREALKLLSEAGAVDVTDGFIAIEPAWGERAYAAAAAASPSDCARVAVALTRDFPADPFAQARVAELLLRAGDIDGGDAAHARALARMPDALARRELVLRWEKTLARVPGEAQLSLRTRAAERSMRAGEAEEAYHWAKSATALAPEQISIALLFGRAAMENGDLVTAEVTFKRARELATDARELRDLAAELAELAYVRGDLGRAREEAQLALLDGVDGVERSAHATRATYLRARNTLGKILLAESKWDEAEHHFAEDAYQAAAASERTAELRARLNRAIALLSKGRVGEATVIFQEILDAGHHQGELRACAFAYHNLAVAAMWRHDYGAALVFFEQGLKLSQRLGDRLRTVRILANVAELRHRLGLHRHAEHALVFGRRSLGAGMPHDTTARFSVVAASIALERGKTAEARREVARAIAEAEAGQQKAIIGEAHRLSARIALEDGDLAQAREALAAAQALATTDDERAEILYLEAVLARAAGASDFEVKRAVAAALATARTAPGEETLREVWVFSSELRRAEGELEEAVKAIEQAILLRDQVASTLEGEVRAAFLARRDIAPLSTMLAQLESLLESRSSATPETVSSMPALPSLPRLELARVIDSSRELVGDDPAIRALHAAVKKVARADSTVLIRGESGTGKELVAEALHRASARASGPLVTVNCAALVETLLLSELFGHEKGAFTGASARRRGRFEMAEGGTLFLDEIGDISARTQVALLRVLQERTFERVGGTSAIRANVRIVCATHRDLRAMVERGEFREDLYYRLRGITLEVPALRQRLGDVPRISEALLERIAAERGERAKTLSPTALELLMRHRWPGNVRELENALRAAALFAEGEVIELKDLTDNVDDLRAVPVPTVPSAARPSLFSLTSSMPSVEEVEDASGDLEAPLSMPGEAEELPADEAAATSISYACIRQGTISLSDLKRQIERDCIARALAETKGNITRAAALLGMKRPRLSQLVKQYGFATVSEGS